ncbi:MAG: OmpA family protein [Planctomycetota bacterium]
MRLRPLSTARSALACMLLSITAVGCASDDGIDPTLEELTAENQELRDRYGELEDALRTSEEARRLIEQERDEAIGENSDLRTRLSSRPTAGAQATDAGGFGGIEGTNVSRRNADLVVEVAGDVLFSSGKVTLRNDAKQTLDRIASVINSRYAGNEIRIAGHTDTDPIRKSGWKTNERLSAERALAVEEYLATRGISKDRMYIAGFGPAEPRGSKKESRRVEIVILAN